MAIDAPRHRWTYPRIIAHRCGGALAPENTLAGLRVAARLGFRAVEFDAMLSADDVPVLIHDETIDRTCNAKGAVAQMSSTALRALDAGGRHHRAFAGEPLPTLEAALSACHALGLAANVELKPARGHETATGRIVAQTVAHFVAQRPMDILLSSFLPGSLDAARHAAPELPRALLVEDIPQDWSVRLRDLSCIALHCDAQRLPLAEVAAIRAAGVPVACYTVNAVARAAELFSAGVAAIFTDRLDLFTPDGGACR